jgi:ketosteroid isomerase-like protein
MLTARTIFDKVDTKDIDGLLGYLTDDATMIFGNGEPLHGRDTIRAANNAFFEQVKAVRHEIRNEWTIGDTTVAETEVTYTRLDGKEVALPVVSIWHLRDGLISDYRVFSDPAPIFAPQVP